MQQRLEIQIGAFADQFEFDLIGPVQRFLGAEFEYLKVVGKTFNVEFENDLLGLAEHPHVPVSICRHGTLRGSTQWRSQTNRYLA